MKLKRLSALALALVLSLSLTVPAFAEEAQDIAPVPQTREELALAAVQAAMTYGGATAAQYALWEDGKITLSGTTGVYSKTENRTLTETDLYGIGSVSKVYTAAAMMVLAEQGKVNLDNPVTKYLPDFKMADERYKDITVRMLLNHSSGLMGGSTNDAFLFADNDRVATDDLLNRLSTQRLKAAPGEIAVYCNDGFTLSALVIEKVSGKSYGDFIRENLLKPAGLSNTFAPLDDFDTSRLVKIYASATATRALPQDSLGIAGCGDLYATASDLAAFGGALTGTKMLSAKSTTAMANAEYKNGIWPEDDADMLAYGLGWDSVKVYPFALDGIQALNKGGDTLYYHAGLVVIPEYKMAVAVLTSGGAGTYNEMAGNQILIEALKAKGVTVTQTAPALPEATPADMPAELSDFSGYYGAFSQQMKVTIAEGKLTMDSLTVPIMPDQVYDYHSDGTFRDATGQGIIKPVVEKNGVTYLYQKAWANLPGLGMMPISNYFVEKLPDNAISAETQAAWDAMMTLPTVPVNMKYTSQVYVSLLAQAAAQSATGMPEFVPGYFSALRILDETNAHNELRVPGTGSRDSQDMVIYEVDGITCQTTNQGIVYADANKIMHNLYAGPGAYSTIGENGWARWYTVGEKAVGKTMTVTLPEDAGFYVYDANGAVVSSSVAYGDTTAVLPEGGMIVFAGDPGARFYLTFAE